MAITLPYSEVDGEVASGVQTQANFNTVLGGVNSILSNPAYINLSGLNTGDQTITLTGDVTGGGLSAFPATISAGAVSLSKMANVATATVFYRKTAGTGSPEVQTLATLKTDLGLSGINTGDQVLPTRASLGLATTDTVTFGNFSGTSSGTNTGDQVLPTRASLGLATTDTVTFGNLSGTSSGTNTGDQFTAMTSSRLLGRTTAGFGAAEQLSVDGTLTLSGGSLSVNRANAVFTGTFSVPASISMGGRASVFYGDANNSAVRAANTGSTYLQNVDGSANWAVFSAAAADFYGNVAIQTNGKPLYFKDAGGSSPVLVCQTDNNFVFYNTDATGGGRAIWSSGSRSNTSVFSINVPCQISGNLVNNGNISTQGSTGGLSFVARSSGPTGTFYNDDGTLRYNNGAERFTFGASGDFAATGNISTQGSTGGLSFVARSSGPTGTFYNDDGTLHYNNGAERFTFGATGNFTASGTISASNLSGTNTGDQTDLTLNFIPAGTGATSRTVRSKLRDTVSVKDFGAVGDGVTNDHAAVGLAIAGSNILRWPAGTYMVDSLPTPAAAAKWYAEGQVIIKRRPTSTASAILTVSNDLVVEGIEFDGNKANNANPCNVVVVTGNTSSFINCGFRNAKASGGYGGGLVYVVGTPSQVDRHVLRNNYATGNDGDGFSGQNISGLVASGNFAYQNTGSGFNFNNYDLTFAQKITVVSLTGNTAVSNGASGIVFGNFIQNNSVSSPVYGTNNFESAVISVTGSVCLSNGAYGLAIQGSDFTITGNVARGNATLAASYGGILFNATHSVLANNTASNNLGFGIDAGFSQFSGVRGNTVTNNTNTGINGGGSVNMAISGNNVDGNGGASGIQIDIHRYEADGTTTGGFAVACINTSVSNNYITLTGGQRGVYFHDGVDGGFICGNEFQGPNINLFVIAIAQNVKISNNRLAGNTEGVITAIDGSGNLIMPEVAETILTNSTTTVTSIDFYSAMSVVGRTGIGWVTITAPGSGYTSAPTVTFTGGGGSGATAQAFIDKAGTLTGVRMSTPGTGYTSAPTIGFTGGGGSGATATATVSVPLMPMREVEIYSFQAQTINRVGNPVVENKGAANVTMAARDVVRLKSFSGQWNVMSRAA